MDHHHPPSDKQTHAKHKQDDGVRPKTKRPVGKREKLLRTPLPYYSGPYSVGYMDLEIPAREPRTFSDIKRDGKHLLELETVLFSIYYPSAFGSGQGKAPDGTDKWSRATWLPRPRIQLAKAYGKFAQMPQHLMAGFFGATTMFTKLPAFRNARLAEHWPPDANAHTFHKNYHVKNEAGIAPPGEPDMPIFPMLIFSHGLGGTRTTYSSVCGEFASYGFVVIALEHRDGSGPRTYINLPEPGQRKAPLEQGGSREEERSQKDAKGRGYDKMDYVFPTNNPRDTMPGNKQGVDAKLRKAQIELRLAELEEAYHIMEIIHAGEGDALSKMNLRQPKALGASSHGLIGVNWMAWKHRFHLKEVTMLGHSFGAATTVEVLRHQNRFQFVGQGVLYDPWGAAVQPPEDNPKHRIKTPLLCINSEAFMYWPNNYDAILTLCEEAKEHEALCWMMTVRGTIHVSQSDFSLLYPKICSLALKMTANPQRAIDININATLEFLKLVMPDRISAMNRGTNEHLLEVDALDRLPEEHKPAEKWTAMRLRVPHELTLRLTPRFVRHYARAKSGRSAARTPDGKVLDGLYDIEGPEIWMHVAPTQESLEQKGIKLGKSLTRGGENHKDGIIDCEHTKKMRSKSRSKTGKVHLGLERRLMGGT